MERAAGFARDDAPAAKLAKLQALLAATAPPMEDVALIAELHSLPSADIAPPLDVTPQRKKEKTFEALLRQIERLVAAAAGADGVRGPPLDRPELARTAGSHDRADRGLAGAAARHVPPRVPAALDRAAACDDAGSDAARPARHRGDGRKLAGNPALSAEIVEEIAERTDGVPLFVEELTKAVLESGARVRQRCPPAASGVVGSGDACTPR